MQLHEIFSEEEIELLQSRAERVAARLQEEDSAGRVTALIASVQGEKYALPINEITAVYQDVNIIPVPCVPDFVAGITNVRGHLVSVLDLAELMGLQGSGEMANAVLIVAETKDASIGFRVGAIGEVIELAMSQISPVPANMNLAQSEYFQGIFPDGTALLKMSAVLNDPRLSAEELGS